MKNIFLYALLMLVLAALPMEAGNPRGGNIRYNGDLYLSTSSSGKNGYGAMGAIETCHGIEIKRGSFIGIGTGATYSVFFDDFYLPLFIKGSIDLKRDSKIVPFIEAKMGGMFCVGGDRVSNVLTMSPAIGLRHSKLFITLGYEYIGGVEEWRDYVGAGIGYVKGCCSSHGARLTLGFRFR